MRRTQLSRLSRRKSYFLVVLACPAAPVHHPRKVGLDPGCPFEAKATTKVIVLGRKVAQFWSVSLVHDNLSVGVLR